ncbi:MarR family winged helix-turn-helix transcriptional regulator [Nonomuraea aridisoli]|uniref:MarR family transcriptional regulator n=1 Tax=Nonomuraea aridisoli TaxID=2070368 RepID=A0A2W2F4D2_9ACTN|nr:MarR family transcriptional regulator [Nonomuraea aridisoli]PZG16407.1 MarR family transcriptional regulator [Nonomuraea aridisoli]
MRADAADMADAFREVARLVLRHLSVYGDLNITALSTLSRLDREGPLRLTTLAAAESIAQPSMTQVVKRLEQLGLARRVGEPQDARVVLVTVTDAGRSLLEEHRQAQRDRLAELLSELSPAEREVLDAAMRAARPAIRRLLSDAAAQKAPTAARLTPQKATTGA